VFAVAVLAIVLYDDPPAGGQALPLTTKPIIAVVGLTPKHVVQVTDYISKDGHSVSRVYRYTFQADYKTFLKSFALTHTAKDGWRSAPVSTTETDLWRTPHHRKVDRQGFIVQKARLVPNPAKKGMWKALPAAQSKGWLFVSYNEQFKI